MEAPELRERGGMRNGQPQYSDKRLFVQLLAFGACHDTKALVDALTASGLEGVLYQDLNDIHGVALVSWSDDPNYFVDILRPLLQSPPFAELETKPEYSMFGRTYALGYEPNLEDWLMEHSKRAAANPETPWAVWYPLRRKGEFSTLPSEEQGPILAEHGKIGHAFGAAGHAQDIRLACFGLDKNDNDFVIALTGKELHPLSACIQAMRKTRQTSRYIEQMGPFFVGKAVWQHKNGALK